MGHTAPSKRAIPGCCVLIYGPKIIIPNSVAQIRSIRSSQSEERGEGILIYVVHMRIALSLAIIKSEGNRRAAKKRNPLRRVNKREPPTLTSRRSSIYFHVTAESIDIRQYNSEPFILIVAQFFFSVKRRQSTSGSMNEKTERRCEAYAIARFNVKVNLFINMFLFSILCSPRWHWKARGKEKTFSRRMRFQ